MILTGFMFTLILVGKKKSCCEVVTNFLCIYKYAKQNSDRSADFSLFHLSSY